MDLVDLPSSDLTALARRVWGSFLGLCAQRFVAMAGIDRCVMLSSQAFTAIIPLMLVISVYAPSGETDVVAESLIRKFGLTGDAATAVEQLFHIPSDPAGVGAFSAALLFFSGVSFTRRLQTMYRMAWRQDKAGVRSGLFAALGLIALLAEILILFEVRTLVRGLPASWLLTLPVTTATGVLLWTSIPYLLLNRQVHWRRLLVAGGLAAVATSVYGIASTIYMPGMIEQYTQQYGLFGVTIALIGWLLAVSAILVVAAAVGAEFDASHARWVVRLKIRFRLTDPHDGIPVASTDGQSGLNAADLLMLFRVLVNWLVIAAAVWAATAVVPGIDVPGGFFTYLFVSLLLGLVNAILGPLLHLIALPLSVLTLGLSALVVNGILLAVTAGLSTRLDIAGLGSAILGALVIAVVTTVLELVLRPVTRERAGGALTRAG
jgi:membrane protein